MILVKATPQRGVVSDGFQTVALPAAKLNAKFLQVAVSTHIHG